MQLLLFAVVFAVVCASHVRGSLMFAICCLFMHMGLIDLRAGTKCCGYVPCVCEEYPHHAAAARRQRGTEARWRAWRSFSPAFRRNT